MGVGRAEPRAVASSMLRGMRAYEPLSRVRRKVFERFARTSIANSESLGVLRAVADSMSEVVDVEQALDLIVESAKRIIGTDKAILVLLDEGSRDIDRDSMVVRGRRDQHEQQWWEHRLVELCRQGSSHHELVLEQHPAEHAWLMVCPVTVKGTSAGLLCAVNESIHPFTQAQKDAFMILSVFAASSIESLRLAEQRRCVHLANERDRIAREMHDGVVQSLFSISLGLEVCKKRIDRDPEGVRERIDALQTHLNSAMTELRRFIYELRPVKLSELGLVGAVEFWVAEITSDRKTVGRVIVEDALPRLTPSEEAVLYRVAKEAVSNAVRHSSPDMVTVSIAQAEGSVRLIIEDDGEGFDVERILANGSTGIGLSSITERVGREGGTFEIHSRPGLGTKVVMLLPLGGGC